MTSERDQKRARFSNKSPRKSTTRTWLLLAVAAILALGVAGYALIKDVAPIEESASGVAETGSSIEMTDIATPNATDGRISLSLSEIKQKQLVYFTFGPESTPVLAYQAPSGKVVTAISMCEPCQSDRFHIEGNQLVCNACGTRWTLEDLKGISGGCPEYPPQALKNQVSGDSVTIGADDILGWKPRI